MADNTKIEWADKTFNPWVGCQKVGPGCDHCYAEAWDARGLQQRDSRWGAHSARTRTSEGNWSKPRAWDRAARAQIAVGLERPRVFCASLADVFDNHASILPKWRADLWALIRSTPHLDWMLLTKRPGNIAKMLPPDWGSGYPNVWLGCTVVNQEEADRDVPKLLAVPAAVRFLSMEPLLGPVDLALPQFGEMHCAVKCKGSCLARGDEECPDQYGLPKLDLVIVGGESGPGARPMHPDWARSLRDQCVAAGVAFHFKQWGEWFPYGETDGGGRSNSVTKGEKPGDWHEWTTERGFSVRIGKKSAGRLLDGRTWDQMPEVLHG